MVRIKSHPWIACAGFALLGLGGTIAGPEPSGPPPAAPTAQAGPERSARLHENYLRDASEYDFSLDAEKRRKLELRREPVMRWASARDHDGEVYVWVDRGRAAVVGCIFSGPGAEGQRRVRHEFHSLATGPMVAGGRGGSGWRPEEAGITPLPVPDAAEPAGTPARRLTQMHEMARRFTAQVDRADVRSELRLLPRPIYRHEITDEDAPIVDGAVFAFVWTAGTDPEVLLVIEAHRTDQGLRWTYAPARFTNRQAWLKYQGEEVWRAAPATVGIFDGVTTKRYGAFSVKTIPDPGQGR